MTICSECGQDHEHQREYYPVGSTVESVSSFYSSGVMVYPGDLGQVIDHTDDGRAVVRFQKDWNTHTFHHIGSFIKPTTYPPEWYAAQLDRLRAELATARAEWAAAVEQTLQVKAENEELRQQVKKYWEENHQLRADWSAGVSQVLQLQAEATEAREEAERLRGAASVVIAALMGAVGGRSLKGMDDNGRIAISLTAAEWRRLYAALSSSTAPTPPDRAPTGE